MVLTLTWSAARDTTRNQNENSSPPSTLSTRQCERRSEPLGVSDSRLPGPDALLTVVSGSAATGPRVTVVSLSASELYEAAMALSPAVRKDVALRLLESLELADQVSVDDAWLTEIGARADQSLLARSSRSPASRCSATSPRGGRLATHDLRLRVHPEAQAELVADVDWYDERDVAVGSRFVDAIRAAIDWAAEDPATWPILPGWDREPIVRSPGRGACPVPVPLCLRRPRRRAHARRSGSRKPQPRCWQSRIGP